MKHTLTLLTALLRVPLAARSAAFQSGEIWLGTAAKPINTHSGGMPYHKGTYYWCGENKQGRTGLTGFIDQRKYAPKRRKNALRQNPELASMRGKSIKEA